MSSTDLPGSVYATSFGSEAARYDRYRPSYPAAAVQWVLTSLHGRPRRVVDLGAGTGKLTESLIPRADEVIAVEPDSAMLGVLAAAHPTVTARPGSSEAIPVEDGSVDAVFAGQAFHWFSRPATDIELARVLRPGGVLGLIWNFPDRETEWIPKLYEATRDDGPDTLTIGWAPLESPDFTPGQQRRFAHRQVLPGPDGLLNLVHTWSWVITRSPSDQADIDRRVRALIADYPELQKQNVVMPISTLVVRHVRR